MRNILFHCSGASFCVSSRSKWERTPKCIAHWILRLDPFSFLILIRPFYSGSVAFTFLSFNEILLQWIVDKTSLKHFILYVDSSVLLRLFSNRYCNSVHKRTQSTKQTKSMACFILFFALLLFHAQCIPQQGICFESQCSTKKKSLTVFIR